ncbi:MAG: Uncharacterized protein LiPW30_766 [Parcubacteria group bacterium LiPW_30]|nr:MAG: Uncharacterized protein LiPW30_766 [Parcubacteria group bacterium LiPW_30]
MLETIGQKLPNGTYQKDFYRQGFVYKNFGNFQNQSGVCYVPELSETEYTYQDFLEMSGGNAEVAKDIFETVDWQHPETYLQEIT